MAAGNPAVTININAQAASANAALKQVGANIKGLQGASSMVTDGMNKLNGSLSSAVSSIAGLATAYLGLQSAMGVVNSLISVNKDFEQSMQTVRSIVQLNAGFTEEGFKRMHAEARRVGAVTRYSADEAAQGLKYLAQTGFTAAQSTEALADILSLAQAANMDLGRTSEITATMMMAFGAETSDTARFCDVLAKAASLSATDVEQLSQAMKYAAPIAAGLGQSLEQTAEGVAVLSNSGMQSDMAGTGIRMMLLGLVEEGAKGIKVAKELGLSFDDLNPKTHSLAEITKKLKDANFGVIEAYKAFGARGGAAASILVKNADAIEETHKALLNAKGSVSSMAATMDDSLQGAIYRVTSGWEEMMLQIGDGGFGESVRSMVESVATLFEEINNNGSLKGLGQTIGNNLTASVEALVSAFKRVQPHLSTVVTLMKGLLAVALANKLMSSSMFAAASNGLKIFSGSLTRAIAQFGVLRQTGTGTFAAIGASAANAGRMMSVGLAKGASGIAAINVAMLALMFSADAIKSAVEMAFTGGWDTDMVDRYVAAMQDAGKAVDDRIDATNSLRNAIANLRSEEEKAAQSADLDKRADALRKEIAAKENALQVPEFSFVEKLASVPPVGGAMVRARMEGEIEIYKAGVTEIEQLEAGLAEVLKGKESMSAIPKHRLIDPLEVKTVEDGVVAVLALKARIIALNKAKAASEDSFLPSEEKNVAIYTEEIALLQKQLSILARNADINIEVYKAEQRTTEEKKKQVALSLELIEKASEMAEKAKLDNEERSIVALPDKEQQIKARLTGVDVGSTSALRDELIALTSRTQGGNNPLTEDEVARYEKLLEVEGKIYDLRTQIQTDTDKKSETANAAEAEVQAQLNLNAAKLAGNKAEERRLAIAAKARELDKEGVKDAYAKAQALIDGQDALDKKGTKDNLNSTQIVDSKQSIGGGGNFYATDNDKMLTVAERSAKANETTALNTGLLTGNAGSTPKVALTPTVEGGSFVPPKTTTITPTIGSTSGSRDQMATLLTSIRDVLLRMEKSPGFMLKVRTTG